MVKVSEKNQCWKIFGGTSLKNPALTFSSIIFFQLLTYHLLRSWQSQPSITKLMATFAGTIFILPISHLIGRIIGQKQRCWEWKMTSCLIWTNLSAAFDTVDHNVLLSRLHSKFGISGTALEWFSSYLGGRSHRVMVQGNLSQNLNLNLDFGVPQGSCLGPVSAFHDLCKQIVWRYQGAPPYGSLSRWWHSPLCVLQFKQEHWAIRGCHYYSALCDWYT